MKESPFPALAIGVLLDRVDGVYLTAEKPKHAAQIISGTDVAGRDINDKRPLLGQADVDKIIAACLEKMGEVAFSDAYDEGQKMTLDEVVAYALGNS